MTQVLVLDPYLEFQLPCSRHSHHPHHSDTTLILFKYKTILDQLSNRVLGVDQLLIIAPSILLFNR